MPVSRATSLRSYDSAGWRKMTRMRCCFSVKVALLTMGGWSLRRSMVRVQAHAATTHPQPGGAEIRRQSTPPAEGARVESGSTRGGGEPDRRLPRLHRTRRQRADAYRDSQTGKGAERR